MAINKNCFGNFTTSSMSLCKMCRIKKACYKKYKLNHDIIQTTKNGLFEKSQTTKIKGIPFDWRMFQIFQENNQPLIGKQINYDTETTMIRVKP